MLVHESFMLGEVLEQVVEQNSNSLMMLHGTLLNFNRRTVDLLDQVGDHLDLNCV